MKVSFVTYFHSSRLDNLLQTLYFLEKREPDLAGSELISVCQDRIDSFELKSFEHKLINLDYGTYFRARMTNIGVQFASHPILILIDSDRILPKNYFAEVCQSLCKKQVVTTEQHYRLSKPYSNEDIESGEVIKGRDFRSRTNELFRKNMFSGNTIMWKKDFIRCGGMDERYIGYGFCDTDMTKTVETSGLDLVFLDKEELHLDHSREIIWKGQIYSDLKIITTLNALRYCQKWKIPHDNNLEQSIIDVLNDLGKYPKDLQDEFLTWMRNRRLY